METRELPLQVLDMLFSLQYSDILTSTALSLFLTLRGRGRKVARTLSRTLVPCTGGGEGMGGGKGAAVTCRHHAGGRGEGFGGEGEEGETVATGGGEYGRDGKEGWDDGGLVMVCGHWRVGDWSYPMSPETLVDSVKAAVEIFARDFGGGGHVRWAVFLASDATDAQVAEVAAALPLVHVAPSDTPWRRSRAASVREGGGGERDGGGGEGEKEREAGGEGGESGGGGDKGRAYGGRGGETSEVPESSRAWASALREEEWEEWEEDAVQHAILDQLVCSQADVFVGTRLSTFSEAIVEERIRLNKPLASNFLVP
jgi:hypothetical protein